VEPLPARIARLQLHLSAIQRELLPSKDIMRQIQSLMSEDHALLTAYGSFQGDESLRSTLATLLSRVGVRTSGFELLVTSGAQQGIDPVARTFIGHGDVVVMEAPTYNGAIDVFASRGTRIVTVPVDRHGMDVQQLARVSDTLKPKLIYTTPTYHNPTGTVLPGSVCFPGTVEHRYVRVCFTYMPEDALRESVTLLGELIRATTRGEP
jgi:DNA-binding transcriptional MocR family regulator